MITRQKAEMALIKSEAKFRELFNKDLTGNFISTVDGKILLINESFARIFGYSSIDELMKAQANALYCNDRDRELFIGLIRKCGKVEQFEEILARKDGKEIVVLENVIGEFDENHELVRLNGYLMDITDRKQAENQLRESETLLKASQEISAIGSYILNIKLGIWKGSVVLDKMFGLDAEDDHSVNGWLQVVHPEDREMMANYFAHDVLELHGRFDKEYRVLVKNSNSVIWVHGIGEVEYGKEGEPHKMIGTIQDITGRRLAAESVRRNEELLKSVIDNSSDLITLTDDQDHLVFMSPQSKSMLGISGDSFIGRKFPINIHPDDDDKCKKSWVQLKNTGAEIRDVKYRIYDSQGELRWLNHSAKQVLVGGKVLGIQSNIRDITDNVRLDQELLIAKEKAEAGDRLKSAFLNNISHEVRTPLNGILGFGELITEPDLSDENKALYLDMLNVSGKRLLNTINDYMDISMISSGNMEIRHSLFNLNDLVCSMLEKFYPLAKKKSIEMKVAISDLPKSLVVDTDADFLRKILTHLLDNAVKYSIQGTIEFGYKKSGEMLEFFVKDEGIGINPDKQARIFEYFIQEDLSASRRYEGSGLGLSIAKGLVELLGGRIWVESEKGIGSIFRFTIRLRL